MFEVKASFRVEGTQFDFENKPDGTEVISKDGEVLSSSKTQMGGKHEFNYQADQYLVKVRPGLGSVDFKVTKNGKNVKPETDVKDKPPLSMHLACGWPLLLTFIGGALGGALGGVAYVINFSIYKSKLPIILKIILNIATGVAAFVLWIVIGAVILAQRN